jgi:hypothetical protein
VRPRNRYRAKFGLWHGPDISVHDVHTSGEDEQAALRRAIRGVIRTRQPMADKEAVRHQLRSALSTIGRHYEIHKMESTRKILSRVAVQENSIA